MDNFGHLFIVLCTIRLSRQHKVQKMPLRCLLDVSRKYIFKMSYIPILDFVLSELYFGTYNFQEYQISELILHKTN